MTDKELADQVKASLEATTISYPAWLLKLQQGKYTPPDGSTTNWGKAFAALAQIGVVVMPPLPPPSGTVAAPLPPSSYSVPAGAKSVTTSAELDAALADNSVMDIVLADGVYDRTSPFQNGSGKHIYAANLLKATLRAGIVFGGNFSAGGGKVQGVNFDVSDNAKCFQGGIINTWGNAGDNTAVLDCAFEGNKVVGTAVFGKNPQGMDLQRLVIKHMHDNGLRISDNVLVGDGSSGATPIIKAINDIDIDWVSYPTPQGSGGTAEAGLFIGHPVPNGVFRLRVRNVAVSGIETVYNCHDTIFSDLDIDLTGLDLFAPGQAHSSCTGVYCERYGWRITFQNLDFKGCHHCFNGEWDHQIPGDAAMHDCIIQDGTLDAAGFPDGGTVGVYLDEGSERTTIRRIHFKNQDVSGITAYLNNKAGGVNIYEDNLFELKPGAVPVSTSH